MRNLLLSFTLLGVAALSASAYPPVKPTPKTEPRETPEGAVGEMIRLLEAKEYKKLIETFANPKDLEQIVKREGGIDKLAEEFGKDKAGKLLDALKAVKDAKPEMADEGNKATYKHDKLERPLTLIKVEKFWYIEK